MRTVVAALHAAVASLVASQGIIVSLDENQDAELPGDRDFYEVCDEAAKLFKDGGIRISRNEELYEANMTPDGVVQGATVVAIDHGNGVDTEPTVRFSVAVASTAQRQGIARQLVSSIVSTFGSEYVVEAWVVNPNMVPLLLSLGFDEPHRGWSPDDPFMRREQR